jgi:hypothetical protein
VVDGKRPRILMSRFSSVWIQTSSLAVLVGVGVLQLGLLQCLRTAGA